MNQPIQLAIASSDPNATLAVTGTVEQAFLYAATGAAILALAATEKAKGNI